MNTFKKVKIGDVCTITKGVTGIQKAVAGLYPMVTLAEERTTHNEFQFDCEAVIIPLVSSTGHGHASMKRVHYQKGKFALGSILCAVVPNDPDFLNPKYLHIYLSYLKDKILVPLMRGAANVSLSISNIKTVDVIVPPIERQLEIIELEKVLRTQKVKLDEQNLFQQSHLTLLRRQILQDAISGKLTADWRAQNPDTEPANKLLDHIKAEKEKLIAEKKIKKEKSLPKIAGDEVPFGLPEGWEWCRLGDMLQKIHYGFTASARPKITDVRLLRITDIQDNSVDWENVPGCEFKQSDLEKYLLNENDILIARTGGTIGKTYIVKKLSVKSLFASYLIRAVPSKNISADFIKTLLESPMYWKQLRQAAWGAGQPNVNAKSLSRLIFPLTPRAEQGAIVRKVDRLLGYVAQLEEKNANNANYAELLMQAFLGEVFSQ
jgi:type I restriction enzyme S subunit